jgi:hypothetical protein
MKKSMANTKIFGSPLLIRELAKYGSASEKREVILRESEDVEKFLQEKEKSQKASEKIKLAFK